MSPLPSRERAGVRVPLSIQRPYPPHPISHIPERGIARHRTVHAFTSTLIVNETAWKPAPIVSRIPYEAPSSLAAECGSPKAATGPARHLARPFTGFLNNLQAILGQQ